MDLRKRRKHSIDKLPLGTLRWRRKKRANGTRFRVLMIKVSNRGRGAENWKLYSRYLYELRRGPVPPGKRVIQKDGDLTNFAEDNLVLGSAADVLWLHCHSDIKKSQANRDACSAATIRRNVERAEVRRRLGPLPSRWYAVDLAKGLIVNNPGRKLHHVLGRPGTPNGAGLVGWRLGWPNLSSAAASLLAALANSRAPRRLKALAVDVEALRRELMVEPTRLGASCIRSVAVELLASGLVVRPAWGLYAASQTAIATRGPVCPYVFVRGRDLAGERFAGFALAEPTQEALSA
jgi:hypothetical protein